MRFFPAVVLTVALSGGAFAQRHGGASMSPRWNSGIVVPVPVVPFRTFGSPSGFGSVLFPGTGTPPPNVLNPFGLAPTFVERFGRTINGTGFGRGFGGFGAGFGATAWPIVVGGYPYDGSYDYQQQQQQQPNVTIVMPPQQQGGGMPPVTINQNFGPPPQEGSDQSGIQYYRAPSAQQAAPGSSEDQVLFFIALKDSSVYTAVAYWVEDGTLNYITPQGRHNQVSLDLVDREVSQRLNAGRNVDFRLPPPR